MTGSWAVGLLGAAMVACAPLGFSPETKAFTEEVLQPLAAQQVEERISHARSLLAQINLAKERLAAGQPLTPEAQALLNGIAGLLALNPGDPRGTDLLLAFADTKAKKPLAARKVAYQEALAWIDSRRLPLQREILRRLADRAVRTNKGFAICVDGIQRQYEAGVEGRFIRLEDKPGAC